MSRAGRGVLDPSAVIVIEHLDPDELPAEPVITVVTLAELSVGPLVADDPAERAARQLRLQEVEATFEPLVLDSAAGRRFGQVAAALRRKGRSRLPGHSTP